MTDIHDICCVCSSLLVTPDPFSGKTHYSGWYLSILDAPSAFPLAHCHPNIMTFALLNIQGLLCAICLEQILDSRCVYFALTVLGNSKFDALVVPNEFLKDLFWGPLQVTIHRDCDEGTIQLYADDTVLFFVSQSMRLASKHLQVAFNNLLLVSKHRQKDTLSY